MLYAVYPPYSKSPTDLVGHYGYGLPATNLKAPLIYSPAIKSTTYITFKALAGKTELAYRTSINFKFKMMSSM